VGLLAPSGKPWWQQATAVVSLSVGGAITGLSFVPKMAADISSPASMPINLLALKQSARPAASSDATLRSAIVNVARYYLQMAKEKSPAEMEAIIWQHDSLDGADHGASCAAFASLTLELAAQVAGQQSWVSGGSSYPWPLHDWADVRVDPNPASLGITSILQDAQAHDRWHPLGDGYRPLPGDWVLFGGHVEVITKYANGVLHTVGGNSLPNFSVNAHQFSGPLGAQGVAGFVDNGMLAAQPKTGAAAQAPGGQPGPSAGRREHAAGQPGHSSEQRERSAGHHSHSSGGQRPRDHATAGRADIPGLPAIAPAGTSKAKLAGAAAIPGTPSPRSGPGERAARQHSQHGPHGTATSPRREHPAGRRPEAAKSAAGTRASRAVTQPDALAGTAAIPGIRASGHRGAGHGPSLPAGPYQRHVPSPSPSQAHGTSGQQAFISAVTPGSVAAQGKYGVPASVTIAQAIEESAWGQSSLAAKDNNLFGIKGTGPAGSDPQPTQEFQNGSWVTTTAGFRVYRNVAESIDDHGRLLATSGYYTRAMAVRHSPNAFAAALTGVYATDPGYGGKLIGLMRQYHLYRYDMAGPGAIAGAAVPGGAAIPGLSHSGAGPAHGTSPRPAPAKHPRTHGSPPPPTPAPSSQAPTPGSPTPTPTPTPSTPTPAPSTPAPAPSTPTPTPSTPTSSSPRTPPPSTPVQSTLAGSTPAQSTPAGSTPAATASGAALGTANIPGLRSAAATAHGASPHRAPPKHTPAPDPPAHGTATPGTPAPGTPAPDMPAASTPAASSSASAGTAGEDAARLRLPQAAPFIQTMASRWPRTTVGAWPRKTAAAGEHAIRPRYQPRLPSSVNGGVALARAQLSRDEPLYRDVASHPDISWKLLAACDWMQCKARPGYSPAHGEKLGTVNVDGTMYRTRSEALQQCAEDLAELAWAVYHIDLTAREPLPVGGLANVFAAFRWGGLLKRHHTSAMEFPYSVAGLTVEHMKMRWPNIADPNTPDKPGGRFRMPFGAVPIVLGLGYPATV
jgi:flagellum-specific peptidoglycan hydrolase FlgJ